MAKILGRGIPTSNTYAILGQEYIDQLTGKRYVCVKSRTVTSDKVGEADHHCEWVEESAGGSGGGIIDVTELPTEGIDEQSIYRLKSVGGTEFYLVVPDNGEYTRASFVDVLGVSPIVSVTEDPQNEILSEFTETSAYVYVQQSTGVAYINYSGTIMSLGVALEGAVDGGWSTDVNNETPEVETVYTVPIATYTYHACKDGVWTELSNSVSGARGGVIYIQLEAPDGMLSPASGTLTDEQYTTITADPKNTAIDMIDSYDNPSHLILPCAAWVTGNQYLYKSFEANEKYLFTYLLTVNSDKTWSYTVIAKEL